MSEGDPINDLQLYHSLKNRITELERALINAKQRTYNQKKARINAEGKNIQVISAKAILKLRLNGVIDWTLQQVADEVHLSHVRIGEINATIK